MSAASTNVEGSTAATGTTAAALSIEEAAEPPPLHSRVCLFGLSANPPTGLGGHTALVRHLQSMGR